MKLEQLAGKYGNFYAPSFKVMIDNKKMPREMANSITEISVKKVMGEGAHFSISLSDLYDIDKQEFKWLDHPLIEEGKDITVSMGYGSTLKTMIIGKITGLDSSFFQEGSSTLRIEGHDTSYEPLKKESKPDTYEKMTFAEIVEKIAGQAKLKKKVDNVPGKIPRLIKSDKQSYYDFLVNIARVTGQLFWVEDETLFFVNPAPQKEELTLELGKSLNSFDPSINTSRLYSEVTVTANNPLKPQQPFQATAKAGTEKIKLPKGKTGSQVAKDKMKSGPKRIKNPLLVMSQEHAQMFADAELSRISDSYFQGTGACVGLPEIRPGAAIKLDKLGKQFNGTYRVVEAEHTINAGGYHTRFIVKRAGYKSEESGLLDTIAGSKDSTKGGEENIMGVTPARVTNNQDPDKLGRVKVVYRQLSDEIESDWVQVMTFMGGKARGGFFLPEVDDEALLAFGDGHINRPYVIGFLWNQETTAPYNNEDKKNNIRAITSRSGHEIIFNDDEENKKENLEIHTKAGHQVLMDDTDKEEKILITSKAKHQVLLDDKEKEEKILITSKTGHHVLLDDTENKGKIEIKSKAGHLLLLDDAQGNAALSFIDKSGKNKIFIDAEKNTLNIECGEQMTIKAGKIQIIGTNSIDLEANEINIKGKQTVLLESPSVKIEGKSSTEIKSTSVKIEGEGSVEIKAADLKAQAKANAEIQAGGQLILKGTITKTN